MRWPRTGDWTTVLRLDPAVLYGAPRAPAGPDGELFVATADTVLRVDPGGGSERLAGVEPHPGVPGAFPEAPLGPLPRPATAQPLPHISGLVADSSGAVYVSTESAVLLISQGELTLVADSTTPGTDGKPLIRSQSVDTEGGSTGSLLTSLALASDGAVLAGDSGQQQIPRIAGGTASVLVDPASGVSNGTSLGRSAGPELLFSRAGGQARYSIRT